MELLLEKTSKACTMHLVGRDAFSFRLGIYNLGLYNRLQWFAEFKTFKIHHRACSLRGFGCRV